MKHDILTVLSLTTGRLLTEPESENDNGIGKLKQLNGELGGGNCTMSLLHTEKQREKIISICPSANISNNAELDKVLDAFFKSGGTNYSFLRDAICSNFNLPHSVEV